MALWSPAVSHQLAPTTGLATASGIRQQPDVVPGVEALPLLLEEPDIVDHHFVYLLSFPVLSPQLMLNKILIK